MEWPGSFHTPLPEPSCYTELGCRCNAVATVLHIGHSKQYLATKHRFFKLCLNQRGQILQARIKFLEKLHDQQ